MSKYSEENYSLSRALENIGAVFWSKYKDLLKTYAEDRSRTDILEQIHAEWDSMYNCNPSGTNIRIDLAIKGIYDHDDWDAADDLKNSRDRVTSELTRIKEVGGRL